MKCLRYYKQAYEQAMKNVLSSKNWQKNSLFATIQSFIQDDGLSQR